MDKAALREAIVKQLESEHAVLMTAAQTSKDEATSEESRQEGMYDMRGQSAAYLAEGQALLAGKLLHAIAAYRNLVLRPFPAAESASVGALVMLESKGKRTAYFIGPAHGGIEIDLAGSTVTVITAGSPVGRQLVGRSAGESVTMTGAKGPQVHLIAEIA